MTQLSSTPLAVSPLFTRFVGCDISKHSVMVAAVDLTQQLLLLPARKFSTEKFALWAAQNLKPTDMLVIEAGWETWYYYDLLAPLAGKVVVANPHKVRLIAQTKVKTDAKDAVALARLLAAGLSPTIWIPPLEVRELRVLVAHRQRLIRQRTQARNRLHSLLSIYHLLPPSGDPFGQRNREWWEQVEVPPTIKLLIKQQLNLLESLAGLIAELEKELALLSTSPNWLKQSSFLIQLPGIGIITAMVILSAIGETPRFETAKQLVGYAGLGASIYASGTVSPGGRITKQGRVELRTALVEAAWAAALQKGYWQTQFERLSPRLGRAKAMVAIA
jgi:transposase